MLPRMLSSFSSAATKEKSLQVETYLWQQSDSIRFQTGRFVGQTGTKYSSSVCVMFALISTCQSNTWPRMIGDSVDI